MFSFLFFVAVVFNYLFDFPFLFFLIIFVSYFQDLPLDGLTSERGSCFGTRFSLDRLSSRPSQPMSRGSFESNQLFRPKGRRIRRRKQTYREKSKPSMILSQQIGIKRWREMRKAGEGKMRAIAIMGNRVFFILNPAKIALSYFHLFFHR